jgi:hypothetical protein
MAETTDPNGFEREPAAGACSAGAASGLAAQGAEVRDLAVNEAPTRAAQRARTLGFAAALLLSAFLLFAVQPMFAKMVLPLLGGAPAVWAVSMGFFQSLLLAGYGWAYVLDRGVRLKMAIALQLALLGLAALTLPVGLPANAAAGAPQGAYGDLIAILAAGMGLPFFALAANSPLLQAWFSRFGDARSSNAYLLYGASNAGSLAALLAYPTLIEPLLPLTLQSRVWSVGFLLLAAVVAGCGLWVLRGAPGTIPYAAADAPRSTTRWSERLSWALLAFVPSGLLVAFTTYVTTDLASAPLLWVVPLAVYLATFIAAFRARPPPGRRVLAGLEPAAVAATLVLMEWDASFAWLLSCIAGMLAFALTALLCHRELYERRPHATGLTEFYVWLSAGGAAGGMFSALLAPHIFTSVLEYPLLLGLGLVCRRLKRVEGTSSWRGLKLAAALAAGAALVWLVAQFAPWAWTSARRLDALVVLAVALVATWRTPALEAGATLAIVLALALLPNGNRPVHVARSFYGTHKVIDVPNVDVRLLLHGVTVHGAERISEVAQGASTRPLPLAYFHPSGPLARGVELARLAAGGPSQPLRVAVVGLGAGAMACNGREGDGWRFFELDPEVIRIATNAAYFSYLSACQPRAQIVQGDARLMLAREPPGDLDYLVIDAFSSDAIPIHLLTVEALELYMRLLAPRGVLAMHVSNQNFDLPPIVESNIAALGGLWGVYVQGQSGGGAARSQVVLIARDPSILAAALRWPNARPLGATTVSPWTDDFSNVIAPFMARLRAKWRP